MPSGEGFGGLWQAAGGQEADGFRGGLVSWGQMRCWARLRWSLLMLCLTAVGVKGAGPPPTWRSSR
jgi:hypothetical protein